MSEGLSPGAMLAEEMVRLAIAHILFDRLAYPAEFRLTEFKHHSTAPTHTVVEGEERKIGVSGAFIFNSRKPGRGAGIGYGFWGEMTIALKDNRWTPRRVELRTRIQPDSSLPEWGLEADCREDVLNFHYPKLKIEGGARPMPTRQTPEAESLQS